jgi:hypothetical protein
MAGYIATGAWCTTQFARVLRSIDAFKAPQGSGVGNFLRNQAAMVTSVVRGIAWYLERTFLSPDSALSRRIYAGILDYLPTGIVDASRAISDPVVVSALTHAIQEASTVRVGSLQYAPPNLSWVARQRSSSSCVFYVWAMAEYRNDSLPVEPPADLPTNLVIATAFAKHNMRPLSIRLVDARPDSEPAAV